MFENDYTINGIHATYLKKLVEMKAFDRYIDVYLISAVIGCIYEKQEKEDETSSDKASILAGVFNNERNNCKEVFRNVILADSTKGWCDEDKMNICFKLIDDEEDNGNNSLYSEAELLFNSYSLAGISILYNYFTNERSSVDDVVDCMYNIISEIENRSVDIDDNQLMTPEY